MALLRAHVVRRAEDLAVSVIAGRRAHMLRQAEIDQRERAVLAQHDVSGLQVAVQHADRVHRLAAPPPICREVRQRLAAVETAARMRARRSPRAKYSIAR